MSGIFNTLLYQPFTNALVFLYNTVAFNDLGVAIILLTIVIRSILYPLFYKSYKHQAVLQRLQPEVARIQTTHKDNKEKQAKELMALYRENKINPLSGIGLLFIQLPILIALYRVFLKGFSEESLSSLYSFVSRPAEISNTFLGLTNLNKADILIVVLAVVAQFLQAKLGMVKPKTKAAGDLSTQERIGRQMMYIGPVLTAIFLMNLPAAVGLYWITTSLFSVGQQILINRSLQKERSVYGENSSMPTKNT